eukprot:TRINITY_DN5337_c0_g1_i1.p1 TRINITY_DN5337_c0_g1~~TRINITY_DN5337_c0_g1_i1.p1  ORF type:complete len:312 (+),score=75.19 TRINITY_DN5337_c0_g1_i1:44-979(+)
MMKKIGILLTCVCVAVKAQTSAMINPQVGGSLYFTNSDQDGILYGPFGDGSPATWQIAQWTDPGPIISGSAVPGPGPCHDTSASWYMANENTRVCVNIENNAVELAQASQGLACGGPNEYDLFLSPVGTYGGTTPNWKMPPLGQISYVNMSFSTQLIYANVQSHCGTFPECSAAPDYIYATSAVVLSKGSNAFFYQVGIYDSRGTTDPWACPSSPSYNDCSPTSNWFATTNPFGIDESLGLYGLPCQNNQQAYFYNFNIMPNLINAITSSSGPIQDPDWQDWTVGGGYIGLGGNGLFESVLYVANWDVVYG